MRLRQFPVSPELWIEIQSIASERVILFLAENAR